MAILNFDASTYDPSPSFDVLPVGKYLATIVDSKVKPTKAGTGEYLELVFEIAEGEFINRKIWQRINFRNPSPKAEAAAKRDLSTLCRAVGVLNVQQSEYLHNIPVVIDLQIEESTNGYAPQNRIKTYSSASESNTAAPATPRATTSAVIANAANAASASVPPWKRSAA
jgi:hypothetical protein